MDFTSFDEVVSYMESFTNLEKQVDHYTVRTYRLDRMRALMDHFGHPERAYRKLHIAGSKGKGSTASYLASGLVALGYRTGLYLSPHLFDYRERFLVDGAFADDASLVKAGNILKQGVDDFTFTDQWGETKPTTFELYTTFAFLLYKELRCDWVVLETGLGGRLDATNVVIPEASILCPIELEHTRILGDTIEKIAIEKSKIIKDGVPAFVGLETEDAMRVFQNEAKERNSRLYSLAEELKAMEYRTTFQGERVHLVWNNGMEDHLTLKMIGEVQAQNAALALLTLRTLGLYDAQKTIPALEANTLPGRFEKISDAPAIYVDGAHTVNSLRALVHSYVSLYPEGERTVIYGALLDKDHRHMCSLILSAFTHILISTPGTYKKSDISAIYDVFMADPASKGKDIRLIPDNRQALSEAKRLAGPDGAILVTGSFYLSGAIDHLVRGK
ncbi:MAG: Mur ligase family protein [Sphaerochaeta sp.]|jgi:dihydrofolate synthase/folylpolyglutamate synthase|nr:Mur ligase family protein [Sphaerochaeta sp.]MCI2096994.1 Mur ligase family protein [Sphaerochaeta sp.]